MSSIVQMISEVSLAIEQYKAENPDVDVEAALTEHKELLPVLGLLPSRELSGFVAYAVSTAKKRKTSSLKNATASLSWGRLIRCPI